LYLHTYHIFVHCAFSLKLFVFSLAVPIIPDYLYASDQEENLPVVPLHSEKSDIKLSSKDPALINSFPLLQCQESPVPSDVSSVIQPAAQSSFQNGEGIVTVGNKKVVWNLSMEPEDHGHQIQLPDIEQNTQGHGHQFGNQYTQTGKQKTSTSYKREAKHENKYRNIVHYDNSDKYMPSDPIFEKSDTVQHFQKHEGLLGNLLAGDHNISPTEDRKEVGHEDVQKEQSKIQFQRKLGYTQNHVERMLAHNRSKNIKSVMLPGYLYAQEMSIQHNRTGEEPNNTEQHSVLHSWNTDARVKSEGTSKEATLPSNCNLRYSILILSVNTSINT
jgi:hypothetical protein